MAGKDATANHDEDRLAEQRLQSNAKLCRDCRSLPKEGVKPLDFDALRKSRLLAGG